MSGMMIRSFLFSLLLLFIGIGCATTTTVTKTVMVDYEGNPVGETIESSSTVRGVKDLPCALKPGCSEYRQEYDERGALVATSSQTGISLISLVFGSSGPSVSEERIGNATAASINGNAAIQNAVADQVAAGNPEAAEQILASRAASGNIVGSVGANASASIRRQQEHRERYERIDQRYRHLLN